MTRPDVMLKSLLLNTISHGAVDYVCAPKMFTVRVTAAYGDGAAQGHGALAPSLTAPMSFLAWVQMWLRLILGLEERAGLSRDSAGRYAVPLISYREVEPHTLHKPAANNLEALMRFAPDSRGAGLTVNQYRERFTRLSVLGRVLIYRFLALLRLCAPRAVPAMGFGRSAFCQAPLRPD